MDVNAKLTTPTNNATGNVMYQLFNQLASCCKMNKKIDVTNLSPIF